MDHFGWDLNAALAADEHDSSPILMLIAGRYARLNRTRSRRSPQKTPPIAVGNLLERLRLEDAQLFTRMSTAGNCLINTAVVAASTNRRKAV